MWIEQILQVLFVAKTVGSVGFVSVSCFFPMIVSIVFQLNQIYRMYRWWIHSKASYFSRVRLVKKPAKTLVGSTHFFFILQTKFFIVWKNWSIESLNLSVIREFSLFPSLNTDCNGNSSCKILSITDCSPALWTRKPSQFRDGWKYIPKHTRSYTTTPTTLSRFDRGLNILFCLLQFVRRIPCYI